MMFGVAEDHASNPIKMALGKLKAKGVKFVAVNPVRTGYGAIADEWIGIRPGTDGLFVGSLIHELMQAEKIDLEYLVRFTNSPWLVIHDPGSADDGLFARDGDGKPLAFDRKSGTHRRCDALGYRARADRHIQARGWPQRAARLRADRGALSRRRLMRPKRPRRPPACRRKPSGASRASLRKRRSSSRSRSTSRGPTATGRRHEKTVGRPVSMHAMRGISAHSNGFQTCRMLHLLQILLGSIDCPGGFRYKAPFPRPAPPANRPARPSRTGHAAQRRAARFPARAGGPAGRRRAASAQRIDKAYSWDAPLAAHGLMHMVITNAANGDPYPVDVLFMFMANMSWNSSMNIPAVLKHLTETDPATGEYRIPKIIYSDAYSSEMVAYADLILPDTTYLERWDCISLLDRPISGAGRPGGRDPPAGGSSPTATCAASRACCSTSARGSSCRASSPTTASRAIPAAMPTTSSITSACPASGRLAGFRGADGKSYGRGAPNPKQLDAYIEAGCFHHHHLRPEQRYYKHANQAYLDWAKQVGFIGDAKPVVFQLYLESLQKFRLAAQGHGTIVPPASHRAADREIFRSDTVLVSGVRRHGRA